MMTLCLTIVAVALIASASAGNIDDALNALPESLYDKIPTIPGDNSHYVEGKSRYIWFPDGDDVPHLVDLKERIGPPIPSGDVENAGENNKYLLYTRNNPHEYQVLTLGDKDSVNNSNYRSYRPTRVVVHGWRSSGTSRINIAITTVFLYNIDCNVIVVDWQDIAGSIKYWGVVDAVPSVGEHIGKFLIWLFENVGGSWDTLHLVGHSLGAHVVGNAGRTINGRSRRVTGLDPAGPLWKDNDKALNKDDGEYVEVIHTDGGILGLFKQLGDADFYPNGGTNRQPGCTLSLCSHSRAYELFAATVHFNNMVGKSCTSLDQAEDMECTGEELPMGNAYNNKTGSGIYGLITEDKWPFNSITKKD